MAKAPKNATSVSITLGEPFKRYELRVGNLGISFKARASAPVVVELIDLRTVTEPFTGLDAPAADFSSDRTLQRALLVSAATSLLISGNPKAGVIQADDFNKLLSALTGLNMAADVDAIFRRTLELQKHIAKMPPRRRAKKRKAVRRG